MILVYIVVGHYVVHDRHLADQQLLEQLTAMMGTEARMPLRLRKHHLSVPPSPLRFSMPCAVFASHAL